MANGNGEDASTLKRRRGMIFGSCTRIRTFAESVESITPSIAAQIEERRSKLQGYWSEYDAVQTKLELHDEAEATHRITFEESYYSLSAKLREMLNPPPLTYAAASPSPSTSSVTTAGHFSHIKLPKLELPKFSGKYDEWFPFFDTFNSLIHTNVSLSDIQRLQYLRASLTGDAAKIISALEISSANYEVAWNLLRERYDNKRVIVHSHLKAIMDLPAMVKENIAELRQIVDGATRHIHALQALRRPTSQWDDLLVYILSSKLDALTSREWQLSLTGSELPTLKQFLEFIAHRCRALEASSKPAAVSPKNTNTRSPSAKHQSCVAAIKVKCSFCKGEHLVYHCQKFLALPVSQRITEIRKRKACVNCLRSTDHASNNCPSGNCRICKSKHNTLLHLTAATPAKSDISEARDRAADEPAPASSPTALVTSSAFSSDRNCVMLSTAVVFVYDDKGSRKSCRVLLDSGSQANFVSRRLIDTLGVKTRSSDISISGINKTATRSFQAAKIRLRSRTSSFSIPLDCIVTEHVTDKLPAFTFKRSTFEIPRNLELADPEFHVASEIDILIGAEHFWDLLCVGQIGASPTHPTLHKTRFGWILAGRLLAPSDSPKSVRSFHTSVTNVQLHDQLSRFWDIENVSEASNSYTEEEVRCEQHFLNNLSRTAQGRFIVKLPFKELGPNIFAGTKNIALKRLHGIERRLTRF